MCTIVNVCDAIMGSGKTESAITYMNEHKDQKFIYITPYLTESARIKAGCPDLDFAEPSDKLKKYKFRKTDHTAALIKEGRNITTTHQAFIRYTKETLDDIREKEYTLIIDECVDVIESINMHPGDIQLIIDSGYVKQIDGEFSISDNEYDGMAFREFFDILRTRQFTMVPDGNDKQMFYWILPPELFTSFKDVFILTYLFDGQGLHHFLTIYDIPYQRIGIERFGEKKFRFGKYPGYVPEYVNNIYDMLNILDMQKMNAIGDDYYSLSMSWFDRKDSDVEQLKRNVYNCFNNIWRDVPSDRRLWGSYKGEMNKIKGKGYTKAFVTFNARATNEYRDRDCLVYIANLFMNVNEKMFYQMHGIDVDEDSYALSIMIQWIWRSGIRDGRPVNLYIPSRRMRMLLTGWMDSISKGGQI